MPTNRSILHTCSSDRRTSNGEATHRNTECLAHIPTLGQVFKGRLRLLQRRVLARYV